MWFTISLCQCWIRNNCVNKNSTILIFYHIIWQWKIVFTFNWNSMKLFLWHWIDITAKWLFIEFIRMDLFQRSVRQCIRFAVEFAKITSDHHTIINVATNMLNKQLCLSIWCQYFKVLKYSKFNCMFTLKWIISTLSLGNSATTSLYSWNGLKFQLTEIIISEFIYPSKTYIDIAFMRLSPQINCMFWKMFWHL